MDSEKLLPNDARLDTYFREFGDEVRYDLDEIERSQQGNLLSVDREFQTYETLQILASIAFALERRVIKQGDMKVYESVHRAVTFAYQAAHVVHEEAINFETMGFDASTYLRTIADTDDGYDRFVRDVQLYLNDNPSVAELLDYYIDDIDDGRNYHHAAELAGGMMFMLIERAMANRFISEESKNCSIAELDEQE